jgi:HD-GYP domain-containing protein (c-di-GMP phosphodiesterase class II)
MTSLHIELREDQRALEETFVKLTASTDEAEGYSSPHATRVAAVSDELAKALRLGTEDRLCLKLAALSHDLGIMAMKRGYIKRSGPLSSEERIDLERHPVIGEQEAARFGADRGTQLIIRWHHEWWNGTGYPDGLKGEEIPLTARILRIAESYAALTSARPYRGAFTDEQVRRHFMDWAGLQYDPTIVRVFLSLRLGV